MKQLQCKAKNKKTGHVCGYRWLPRTLNKSRRCPNCFSFYWEKGKHEKRNNECQFCSSKSCHRRIYRKESPEYDEVYCNKHIDAAEKEARRVLKKHLRSYISSNGTLKRGVKVDDYK